MLKSTVPPGVTRALANEFFSGRDDLYLGFSPERLAEVRFTSLRRFPSWLEVSTMRVRGDVQSSGGMHWTLMLSRWQAARLQSL